MRPDLPGTLITFEGIDGCGKSSQVESVARLLRSEGYSVLTSLEPGRSSIGPAIRQLLLESENPPSALTEALLFSADRAQHLIELIKPALLEGKIVLLDRHTDSTLVYQGIGGGFDLEILGQLNSIATDGIRPALTILLDLAPGLANQRFEKEGRRLDRYEREGPAYHQRLREGFLALAGAEPERFRVINADQEPQTITSQIHELILDFMRQKNA